MSEIEKLEEVTTQAKAAPEPSHGEMFFRYIAALSQVAGVQAFTLAIAVPKADGTSAIMSVAAGQAGTSKDWQEETAKLLGESATKAALTIIAKETEATDEKPALPVAEVV